MILSEKTTGSRTARTLREEGRRPSWVAQRPHTPVPHGSSASHVWVFHSIEDDGKRNKPMCPQSRVEEMQEAGLKFTLLSDQHPGFVAIPSAQRKRNRQRVFPGISGYSPRPPRGGDARLWVAPQHLALCFQPSRSTGR